jgi:predicted ATPase
MPRLTDRPLRIAISGSHATGKTTLVSELQRQLQEFVAIDEPFYLLESEGESFASPPDADDYERMIERSMQLLRIDRSQTVMFDRSPIDYLAYLHATSPERVQRSLMRDVSESLQLLDLIVFVPIESPDRIDGAELPKLRRRVDRMLREMLIDDAWGFGATVVEVRGATAERVRQVVAALGKR